MATGKTVSGNFSENEIVLTKCRLRYLSLEMQKMEMLRVKENFRILSVRNAHISKSLTKLRAECELHRADLYKTLYNLKLDSDKQQILCRKKINEFLRKRKNLEDYLKMSPFKMELEELISRNRNLLDQWTKITFLLNLTKNQYEEIKSYLLKTFKMKVCEFCDTVLKLKAGNHKN